MRVKNIFIDQRQHNICQNTFQKIKTVIESKV